MMKYAFAMVLLFSFALADAGPPPPKPDIIVTFTKDGTVHGGPFNVTFMCNEPNGGDSPVDRREIELVCANGVCKNDNWFYKFNPCYYPKSGYFKYKIGMDPFFKNSQQVSMNDSGVYSITVKYEDGSYSQNSTAGFCPSLFILAAIPFLLAFRNTSPARA